MLLNYNEQSWRGNLDFPERDKEKYPGPYNSTINLWEPKHGQRSRDRPVKNYIDILEADMGAGCSEVQELMENWEQWKTVVKRAEARLNSIV